MRRSSATERNGKLGDWSKWAAGKSNSEFFAEALTVMREKYDLGNDGLMTIGLVGSRDIPGITLRRAQSVLRWDRRPSFWSHSFLVARKWNGKADVGNLPLLEIPLHARAQEFPRPANNGVLDGTTLRVYDDSQCDANVALLAVARRSGTDGASLAELDKEEVRGVHDRARDYNHDRLRYDLWDSLSAWQRYLWSDGEAQNPLRAGVPICAASYIEMAFEAIRLDLTPGASERNSAPEHIWNAAVWWWQQGATDFAVEDHPYAMVGCFAIRDPGGALLD